jgi:hypothetical protein
MPGANEAHCRLRGADAGCLTVLTSPREPVGAGYRLPMHTPCQARKCTLSIVGIAAIMSREFASALRQYAALPHRGSAYPRSGLPRERTVPLATRKAVTRVAETQDSRRFARASGPLPREAPYTYLLRDLRGLRDLRVKALLNRSRTGMVPSRLRGRHHPASSPIAVHTLATCSSVSSGYNGSDRISAAARSVSMQRDGPRVTRPEYAGCRCTGTG